MNRAIKEYAEQAGFMKFKTGKFTEEEAIEKFASLLIEECNRLSKIENLDIANENKNKIKKLLQ